MTLTSPAAPLATRKEWIGLAVLAMPALLISMDMTVLYLALPQITADLNPSSTQQLWILDIYGFLIAGFLITMGTLGDRIGRRKLLLVGGAAFAVASVMAAYATSPEMLILTRAMLGIAGATLMPSTLALIRNMFQNDAQRTTAIAVWMSSFMIGSVIGPLVGGFMLERFWWGSVFLLAVPAMVILLISGPLLLPEYRDPTPGRLDLVSVLLAISAVLATIYGIKEFAKEGVDGFTGLPLVALLVGLALGSAFARRQRHLADPLLDLTLFANAKFSASLATLSLALFAMSGVFFFLSQYLQLVVGLSPFRAGLWTLPQAGAMVVATVLTSVAARHIRPASLMAIGMVTAATGLFILSRLDGSTDLTLVVVGQVIMSIGFGPTVILGLDMIVGAAPPERAGAASAISETSQEFGYAVGVAVLGSVGAALYRRSLEGNLPTGLAPEQSGTALDTLAGAINVVTQLPPAIGGELAAAAQAAFTDALQVNALIATGLALGTALLPIVFLRHVQPASHAAEPEPGPTPVTIAASTVGE
jgi:DHA2 family multidrug resistance protein-like MFS transporter